MKRTLDNEQISKESPPSKKQKVSLDINVNNLDTLIKFNMIVFMQKKYEPSADVTISYKQIYDDFKHSTHFDCSITPFTQCKLLIPEALQIAVNGTLKTFSDPVSLICKMEF
eukprot:184337_1